MSKRIADYIKKVNEEKVVKSDPGIKTDLANSLDILSSGIYTEEERFVFELLQNAVDAFETEDTELRIKILVQDGLVVFMHNGSEFSERDIEGICSVGYGEKSSNIKKIGYKGIGFKSVFMHSDHVSIKSGDTIFCFDKKAWDSFWNGQKSDTGREYKMPWQIIPILEENSYETISTEGYNVITYLRVANSKGIASKVEKLMSDCQFLLFLRHSNIRIDYVLSSSCHTISKHSETLRSIDSSTSEQKVSLMVGEEVVSQWLVYKNDEVPIPSELVASIHNDPKTPQKLQNVQSYDLSFAICIDNEERFVPLKNAVLYTYLPTSCHVNLPFLVNANFITDAGRQQLNVDTDWNHMVVSAIPAEFIKWMSQISTTHGDYYKVLPTQHLGIIEELEKYYKESLKKSLEEIAFVPALFNDDLLIVGKTLYDEIGLKDGLGKKRYNAFLTSHLGKDYSIDSLIDIEAGAKLQKYGSKSINGRVLENLLEKANDHLKDFSIEECVKFCKWLFDMSKDESILKEMLSYSTFLIDENNHLAAPNELFFPSDYRDENSIAESAKVISEDLIKVIEEEGLMEWLASLGVHEMSNFSVIKNVICSSDFFDDISNEEAIDAIRFIFDSDKKENIIDKLLKCKTGPHTTNLCEHLKFVTEKGNLEYASSLYLNSRVYGRGINKDFDEDLDIFISDKYVRLGDDRFEWARFFKKIGVNDKIELVRKQYKRGTELWNMFSNLIDFAERHENYLGYEFHAAFYIEVKTLPFLTFSINNYEVCRIIWNNIIVFPITLNKSDDYIYGYTGWYESFQMTVPIAGHNYLGENFLPWALKNFKWLPGSDGNLYRVTELLDNSQSNKDLCGKYFPTLEVDCQIHDTWREYMPFKKELTLMEYLTILQRIQKDSVDGVSKENRDRISLIYRHIADKFSITEGTPDYNTLAEWGKHNMILTSERTYKTPKELLLVSDKLGKVLIENQVFRGRHIESQDNRFIRLMKALGVKFVDSFTPCYEGKQEENLVFKDHLLSLSRFLTLLSLDKYSPQDEYDSKLPKIENAIKSLRFFENESITLSYAGQSIEKKVYVSDKEFHYVGSLGMSNLELMHDAIAENLDILKPNRTSMFAIIQIKDCNDIREYLKEKGFDISLVPELPDVADHSSTLASMSGNDGAYRDLTQEEKRAYLEEAKNTILVKLEQAGYNTENAEWDGWTCIDGITKEGVEYPLVIRSNKSHRVTTITPVDWNQLMKPNALFVVNTNEGVGTINLNAILRSRANINISFSSENIDLKKHIDDLAGVFKYFRGIQFDFGSYITPTINAWERFVAPENITGELPVPTSEDMLPE